MGVTNTVTSSNSFGRMPVPYEESDAFLGDVAKSGADAGADSEEGCMRSKGCFGCCVALGVVGALLVALGVVVVIIGPDLLEEKILESMALTPGGDRTESWLHPPVQPYLHGYAFHVKNPEAILRGAKPILEERGPYVYKAVTIKDSNNNMVWHEEDGTLTYRPRKIYTYEPGLSGPGLDPYTDVVTVPNIPLWTGLNALKHKSDYERDIGRELVVGTGRGKPFVDVTFDGLLWGYDDELPCLRLDYPAGCPSKHEGPFSSEDDHSIGFGFDPWGDGEDDQWGGKRRRRRRRSAVDIFANPDEDPSSEFHGLSKPKAEFVNCSCEWGLFRDRNVTMRKAIRFFTGQSDLTVKGILTEYDGSTELGWWMKGSSCDAVGGQDSSTLPPSLTPNMTMDIFIALMCRSIPVSFEKVYRYSTLQ